MIKTSSRTKTTFAASASVLVALTLSSCSEPSSTEPAQESEPAEAAAPASSETPADDTTLTVCTSEPEDKLDEINAAFGKANPGIKVQTYRAGTGDLNARIESEKTAGSIDADIFWAADAPTFEKYAEAGDLDTLDGIDTSMVIDQARDPKNLYVGTRIIPTVIAYNSNEIDEADAPTSWQDLTKPEYDGKIVMPNPAVSGAAAFNASAWLLEPSLGQEWMEKLFANKPMIAESNGPTSQEIPGGGHPVGIVVDYLVRDLEAKGSPIKAVYPTEGAPYITEPVAIFKDSENQDAAKKYIEFLLSEEGQKMAVEQAYLPVREDVGTPEGAPELADTPLLDYDLKEVTDNQDSAVETFQQLSN